MGKFVWPNGEYFEGNYVQNMKHGKGCYYFLDGSCKTSNYVFNKKSLNK